MKHLLALLISLAPTFAAAQPTPRLQLNITGDMVSTFPGGWPACNANDIPDAPARAIRLADGSVQLYASDQINRVNAGPDLLHLRHRCAVVYQGAGKDDPAAYDDRTWIATPWTADGKTIWAILHNEFHGNERKALCPTGRYMDCWLNALTLARSMDGGASFVRMPGSVAVLPYRYDQVGLGHHGYFNPSNIVRFDGADYMFAFATTAGAQREGNCLLRTTSMPEASSWRGWNGTGFDVAFADPYQSKLTPEAHACAPVDRAALRWPVTSLVRHQPSGLFVALMQDTSRAGGVFYATSSDLLRWSTPTRLLAAPGLPSWSCGDMNPIAYPALIDPASGSRTFETIGSSALLYATRFDGQDCQIRSHRSLIQIQVRIQIITE